MYNIKFIENALFNIWEKQLLICGHFCDFKVMQICFTHLVAVSSYCLFVIFKFLKLKLGINLDVETTIFDKIGNSITVMQILYKRHNFFC